MSRDEYTAVLVQAHQLRVIAQSLDLDAAIEQAQHAESIGSIFDPTSFRENGQRLREDIEVLSKLRELARLGGRS